MFTLIENGDILTPDPAGTASILLAAGKIARIGAVDGRKLAALGVECEVIDASDCYVLPGLIDPHQHILGAGGEQGFASRTPEVETGQILENGITTVVGLLGTDSTTRHLTSLVGRARQFEADGITCYIYTGNFRVPPPTITGSVTDDMVLVDRVIGTGEVAIADARSMEPSLRELARIVTDTMLGGLLTGKAGVTHFHTGPARSKLSILHSLLDEHEIPPEHVYPTHINRSKELLQDAAALAKRGCYVDIDTTEEDLGLFVKDYLESGGPSNRLTVSSDGHTIGGTLRLYEEFVRSLRKHKMPLEQVLPFFTQNTADVLKLPQKGRLRDGLDADLLIIKKSTLRIKDVIAGGRHLLRDGKVVETA